MFILASNQAIKPSITLKDKFAASMMMIVTIWNSYATTLSHRLRDIYTIHTMPHFRGVSMGFGLKLRILAHSEPFLGFRVHSELLFHVGLPQYNFQVTFATLCCYWPIKSKSNHYFLNLEHNIMTASKLNVTIGTID